MRISKLTLFGLAAAIAGGNAPNAAADDVTISTATTTPLATSSPAGGTPGDITVAAGGSIELEANNLTAITVDSNNDVTNSGTLFSDDFNNTTGILINGGFAGSVTNSGAINLREDFTPEDADDDGDLDGPLAEGSNRIAIHLQGAGDFTGTITHSGSISIEGNDSAGILLDSGLVGDLVSTGSIAIIGNDTVGVGVNGGIDGDVSISSIISLRGENAVGVLIGSDVTGALNINNAIDTSGFRFPTRPTNDVIENLDADDLLLSGSAVVVSASVGGGVTFQGIGVEDDEDDDGDGETEAEGDTNDDLTSVAFVAGSAPTVLIAPDAAAPVSISLGATGSGYGFVNRGAIRAAGVYDGVDATALRLQGVGGATVSTAGGILNDGRLTADAAEANATALSIGSGVSVTNIVSRNLITARSITDGADTAAAIDIETGAVAGSLNNSGVIVAQVDGSAGQAIAIRDRSNTLAIITNSGSIAAALAPTDADAAVTGEALALDLSTSTIGVTFNQIADAPFNDDDSVDHDADSRPPVAVTGDMRFGSGADTINLMAGAINGDISFGAGADSFTVDNGATFSGAISDSDAALTINVIDGELNLAGGEVNITSADIGADGVLGIVLAVDPADSTSVQASGAITFADGAAIEAALPAALPQEGTQIFLTAAGGLIGADNVTGVVTEGTPFIYNLTISESGTNSLAATFAIKTANELGLNPNQAAALSPIISGLRLNESAGAAFADLTDQASFIDAYEDLLPNFSSAAAELAATAIQQQQSATANRIGAARLARVREQSLWFQEIGYGLDRDPSSAAAVGYRGFGFGFAAGLDRPLGGGALAGVSLSFISSEVEESGRPSGQVAASFGQVNAYVGTSLGPLNVDLVAGGGGGKFDSTRAVQIGSGFSAESEAEWWAYEGHGAVRLSAPADLGRFTVTPQAALTYVVVNEEAYTEAGGGVGIDYDVDSATYQRLWADAGVEFAGVFGNRRDRRANLISPRLMLGYRANLIDEAEERTFRVANATSADFVLADQDYGDGGPIAGFGITAGNSYSTFSLSYEGQFGDELTRHSLNASVRIRF